jgi:hypothetical protein
MNKNACFYLGTVLKIKVFKATAFTPFLQLGHKDSGLPCTDTTNFRESRRFYRIDLFLNRFPPFVPDVIFPKHAIFGP